MSQKVVTKHNVEETHSTREHLVSWPVGCSPHSCRSAWKNSFYKRTQCLRIWAEEF